MLMRRCSSEPAASRGRRVHSPGECRTAATRGTVAVTSCSHRRASTQNSPSVFGGPCADTERGPSEDSSHGRPSTRRAVARPCWRASQQHCSSELRRHYSLPRPSTQATEAPTDVYVDVNTREPWLSMGWAEPGVTSTLARPHDEMVVRGSAVRLLSFIH